MSIKTKTLIYLVTEDWYFMSHRFQLACAAKAAGFRVIVVTQLGEDTKHANTIREAGLELIPIHFARAHSQPWQDAKTIWSIFKIYRRVKPDLVHHVAIKPVLYGSLAAMFARVDVVINALTGLGYVFSSTEHKAVWIRRVITPFFRVLFSRKNSWIIFQNPDDLQTLQSVNVITHERYVLIRGSGVDSTDYSPAKSDSEPPIVMFAARLIWEKGIQAFVDAAKRVNAQGVKARFVMVGDADKKNPSAVPEEQLAEWQEQDIIEWWGRREDMPEVLAQATIFCLPTFYREGLPKVLIEAAACGKALITTDSPGCREVVRHEDNGLLVPPRNAVTLAEAILRLLANTELRQSMGRRSRERVEQEFTIETVIRETLSLYHHALQREQNTLTEYK